MIQSACVITLPLRLPVTGRRELCTAGKGIFAQRGFTLVELMIGLGVLAIITSLALPSYRNILEKRQVVSGAEQLGAYLSSAQLESVKRNQFVALNYQQNSGDWCFGMIAGDVAGVVCDCTITDASAAQACAVDGALRVFHSSILNYPEVMRSAEFGGDDDLLVYDPVRGLIQNAETVTLELESEGGSYALDVEVSVTGRVKICSNPGANKDVPGYKECSA